MFGNWPTQSTHADEVEKGMPSNKEERAAGDNTPFS